MGSVTHQFVSTVPDDSDPDTVSPSDWNDDHTVSLTAADVGAEDAGAVAAHTGDASDAHDASAISVDSTTLVGTGTDVQAVLEELDNSIASATHDAATEGTGIDITGQVISVDLSELSAGGELAGTLDAPTVDSVHSGSAHHDAATEGTGIDITGQVISVDLSEISAGGELGGTMDAPTVDATHSGSTHSAATDTHIADSSAAHAASAVSVDSTTLVGTGTDVQAVFEEVDNDIAALKTPDYLVGTATATLSGEIAVGTTPGGELGNTWASPTVDTVHSGSAHHDAITIGADTEHTLSGQVLSGADASTTQKGHVTIGSSTPPAIGTGAAGAATTEATGKNHTHTGVASVAKAGSSALTGAVTLTGGTNVTLTQAGNDISIASASGGSVATDAIFDAKGDLAVGTGADTAAKLTVGTNDTILMADSGEATGLKWVASASPSAVGTAAATGTADTFTRGDHVHAHETAHVAHDTIFDAAGDLVEGTAADTSAVLTIGSPGQHLVAGGGSSASRLGYQNPSAWLYPPTGVTIENFWRGQIAAVTIAMTSGTMRLTAINLPKNFSVASISFIIGTTAGVSGSSSHFWVALYNSSLGLLRQSTDNTAASPAASTLLTTNLSSSFVTTYAGLHYIGIMYVAGGGGTQFTITATANATTLVNALAPALSGTSSTSLGATAPDPAASIAVGQSTLWGGVA